MGLESYTIELSYLSNADSSMLITGSGSGGINPHVDHWGFNFDNLTDPTDVIWLTNSVKYPSRGGTFTATYGSASMSGTYQMINGSFSGYQQQFWFHFTSFNKGSETGIAPVKIIGSPPLPSDYISRNIVTQTGLTPIYCSGISDGGVKAYGSYTVRDNAKANNTVTAIEQSSGYVIVSVNKQGYSSRFKVFSGGSGETTAYDELSQNTVNINNLLITSRPLVFQSYMLGHYINSSSYFGPLEVNYSLLISPEVGTTQTMYSAFASASTGMFSAVDAYTVICTSGAVSDSCMSEGMDPTYIKKGDGFWYQINSSYQKKLTTIFPNPISLSFSSPGAYTVDAAFFEISGGGGRASDTVIVSSNAAPTSLTLKAIDSSSGSMISGSTIRICNSNGNWTNTTTDSGSVKYTSRSGEYIGYGATAGGYYESSMVYEKVISDIVRTIILNPIISVPAGNNTLYVYVKDKGTLAGLDGALVYLSDGQTRTTPGSGMATFTVLENATYKITVTKTGYQPLTGSITVAGTGNAISMELSRLTVTTSPTLAPGASPTVDIRTDTQKDADMMGKVRDSGDDLIGIAIIAAMFGLIGLIGKSMK
jgi:hypothetical protein